MIPKKIVFPVAGLGTRFYPATLVTPKELLPVNAKPLIQYAVEEALMAGVTDVIFITHPRKKLIEDHFRALQSGKYHKFLSDQVADLLPKVRFHFIDQSAPKGLGHAVYLAQAMVHEEPFLLSLCDEFLVTSGDSCLEGMLNMYRECRSSVVALTPVNKEDVVHYGIAKEGPHGRITSMVEKPSMEAAPSNMAMIGRYLLSARVFKHLQSSLGRDEGEVQLTGALNALIEEEVVRGYRYEGDRFDCGQSKGYLAANVFMGQKHLQKEF